MGQTIAYLKKHPWQRRILTTMMAALVCALVALLSYPHVRNFMIMRKLGDDRPAVQRGAVLEAARLMKSDPSTIGYFDEALAGANDRTFLNIVRAMMDAKAFDLDTRPTDQVDRYRVLMLEQSNTPRLRRTAAQELLRSRRMGPWTSRAAASAAADADPSVREIGAILAASVGDDQTLRKLLADSDPLVVASAAMDAGLAGRKELAKDIAAALEARVKQATMRPARPMSQPATVPASGPSTASSPATDPLEIQRQGDLEAISNCALALAKLAPKEYSKTLANMAVDASHAQLAPELSSRLLYVLGVLGDDNARSVLQPILREPFEPRIRYRPEYPPAAAIVAGARLNMPEAARVARHVLTNLMAKKPAPVDVVRAACHAAEIMDLPLREEVYDLSVQIWDSRDVPTLMSLMRLLGREAQRASPTAESAPASRPAATQATTSHTATSSTTTSRAAITRADCVHRLFQLAGLAEQMEDEKVDIAEAMPSAQAALECVRVGGKDAFPAAKRAASASPLAAYYIAFQAAQDPKIDAMALGLSMLGNPNGPEDDWTYNTNVRMAGAVLLALAPQTQTEKLQAQQRLTAYQGVAKDLFLKSTYEAALLVLGQREFLDATKVCSVREAGWVEAQTVEPNTPIPTRLPVFATLLLAAGDRSPLDWLLANDRVDLRTAAYVMLGLQMIGPVNHILTEQPLDWSAYDDLQWWQVNLTRHAYALHKGPMDVRRESADKP